MQTPMFQVVGGTDGIVRALAQRVGHITLGAVVQAIEQPAGRVRVRYATADGDDRQVEGAFCISTLPLTVLRAISLDASAELVAAIGAISYSSAGKIGLQFSRRFWEEDEGIFGGITRTDQEITQILYPSTGYLSRKGVARRLLPDRRRGRTDGEAGPAERLQRALDQGALIHPQYKSTFENAFSVAWQNVEYSKGGWAQFTEAQRRHEYPTLQRADGAFYLAGDYTTNMSGWMAGALESARSTVRSIHERVMRANTVTPVQGR